MFQYLKKVYGCWIVTPDGATIAFKRDRYIQARAAA
jgi:hypothetical protein